MTEEKPREKAVRLWAEGGTTQSEIAKAVNYSDRQIRYWLKGLEKGSAVPKVPQGWPEDRAWPKEWTLDVVREQTGWTEADIEGNLAIIRQAERVRNTYVPWYLRRIVELGQQKQSLQGTPWHFALAGLPVLAVWAPAPECEHLAALIEDTEPWERGPSTLRTAWEIGRIGLGLGQTQKEKGGMPNFASPVRPFDPRLAKGRRLYQRRSAPLADAIRQRLLTKSTQLAMKENGGGYDVLACRLAMDGLSERLPMFDTTPKGSFYNTQKLGYLFLNTFVYGGRI